jgi:hypothetical protein
MLAASTKMRLEGGLVAKALKDGLPDAGWYSDIRRSELGTGAHPNLFQAFHLAASDTGNDAQVILSVPSPFAMIDVPAHGAVGHRIGRVCQPSLDCVEKAATNCSEVSCEISWAKTRMLACA